MKPTPKPSPVELFLQRLAQEHAQLSRQLKLIGAHVELHRDHIGLEKIQDIADQCGVQPSAVVRFAKHFGFSVFRRCRRCSAPASRRRSRPAAATRNAFAKPWRRASSR